MKYKHVENYLNYCQYQKRLTGKTLKAYRIDLNQFYTYMQFKNLKNKKDISVYIQQLHTTYKPRTVKRKIAAIKAFYTYLEKQDFLKENPFHKIDYRFKEPIRLPKTITLHELNHLYQSLYAYSKQTSNRVITRDIAILELLICTGIRVSEVSHLLKSNVFIRENTIIINGKGSKERIIYIDNQNLIQSLLSYQRLFQDEIEKSPYFFINRLGHHLSEQSIRFMIVKYCHLFHIDSHITPHMF
ncbi:MAG: tyrosine-type recombinase/integrase, partial [Coprobacillus cateniformis]